MKELSQRQQSILDFIGSFLAEKGYPPSMREIARGCQISSTSVVEYHLHILQKGGHIRRDSDVARGIELHQEQSPLVRVPVIGYIAAGEPIPLPSADTLDSVAIEILELPQKLIQGKEGLYALRVKGISMVDALISEGDLVLMQQAGTADYGDTVAVWLKAEREVTLKKLFWEKSGLRLQPANPQVQPIYTSPDNVEIQGKVICIIRQLG